MFVIDSECLAAGLRVRRAASFSFILQRDIECCRQAAAQGCAALCGVLLRSAVLCCLAPHWWRAPHRRRHTASPRSEERLLANSVESVLQTVLLFRLERQ